MTWLREVLTKMAAAIFPWAPRHERRASIQAAKREKEASRAGREHAEAVQEQIKRLARANHFSQIIADDILKGRHGGRA